MFEVSYLFTLQDSEYDHYLAAFHIYIFWTLTSIKTEYNKNNIYSLFLKKYDDIQFRHLL